MKTHRVVLLPDSPEDDSVWGYCAGIDGTIELKGNKQVLTIVCIAALEPAYIQINNGDLIRLPRGARAHEPRMFQLPLSGTLIDPVISFTGTDSYFIEYKELKNG